mmetsp:Transcript_9250/g.17026  ORF Transcript_9250/g.17026 Transcript_9250/m.17026 type:complete len:323 (-) Transcript_9250:140-1108(-)
MPFAIACVVLLASQAAALSESAQPRVAPPKSGQLDHFSYSLYLDDKSEDKRHLHLPHIQAPPTGGLRKVAKAAPLVAAALTEIPAVREQLSEWLGRDVPSANDMARAVFERARSEVERLGDEVVQSARETAEVATRRAKGAARGARGVMKELNKELNETVTMAEHKAEELILHHEPEPHLNRFSRPWLLGTLGFAAVLGIVASRRWVARRRGPAMAGTRRAKRPSVVPPVVPSRESVLQRTPSQSQLTPIKVHKVEFQRVAVTAHEWDSPDEHEPEPDQESPRREPGDKKVSPKTEYFQISGQQDSQNPSPRGPATDRALGA